MPPIASRICALHRGSTGPGADLHARTAAVPELRDIGLKIAIYAVGAPYHWQITHWLSVGVAGNGNKLFAQPDVGWIGLVPWVPRCRNGEPPRFEGEFEGFEFVGVSI